MLQWLILNSALGSGLIYIDCVYISMQQFESKCENFHCNSCLHPNFKETSSVRRGNVLHWMNYIELEQLKSLLETQSPLLIIEK